jgi:AraC-like DNA-binding protein
VKDLAVWSESCSPGGHINSGRAANFWSFQAMPSPISTLPMPSSYSALVLREWGDVPGLRSALLAGMADPESPVIAVSEQAQQLRVLGAHLPPGWGLKLGALFDSAAHGPLGLAVQSSPTLGDALKLIADYGHVRTPFIRFALRYEASGTRLRFIGTDALEESYALALHEATLVGIQSLLKLVAGDALQSLVTKLGFPRPAHAESYRNVLRGTLRFGSAETSITFDRAALANKSPLADPDLCQLAVAQLRQLAHAIDTEGALIAHVRQMLSATTGAVPALPDIAGKLRLSSRTLARRIAQTGTSYRAVVDAHRRARATLLLQDETLSCAEIGYRLGYDDGANFGRSCRRWFGCSPGDYRRKLRERVE